MKMSSEQPSICCLCKLLEDYCHGCKLIHEVQNPQIIANLYQQIDHLSCRDNYRLNRTAGSKQVLKRQDEALATKVNAHA